MSISPGQAANDLRANARFWAKRLRGKDAKITEHMTRAATLIEAALAGQPPVRWHRDGAYLARKLNEHSDRVAHWEFIFGATQLSTSLWRGARALEQLMVEARDAV
ncbi:hypothetical protein [Roseinatronobacter sp.]|uniref:hypothetical protein n=1 Tax=Roseinatronobacter sp. TaxID=1945755 RepID=UPI0025E4EFC6|nr:hypothetical protein [Roseibaca sp.]